jgi:hypothetical protein
MVKRKRAASEPNHREAFERIRGEYLEMPGMRLTPQQVQRLSGIELSVCTLVLDDLVRRNFLRTDAEGAYVRLIGDGDRREELTKASSLRLPT